MADRKSKLNTDEALAYHWMGKELAEHKMVNHSLDEYFKNGAGVQSAKAIFALLKRGAFGTFHAVSEQHLQRYVMSSCFAGTTDPLLAPRISTAPTSCSRVPAARDALRPTDKGTQFGQADA